MSMQPNRPGIPTLSLEYPMSLGTFDQYQDAQKAVDTLSDNGFPVQNVLIVGTDLKQLERVTARLTWGRVALGGALSGLWLGLFVGLILSFFTSASAMSLLLTTALWGLVFGLVWSLVGYAFTRGTRDFSSVSQVVATKYEVFAEHKVAQQARDILHKANPTTSFPAPTGDPTLPPVTPADGPVPPSPGAPPQV